MKKIFIICLFIPLIGFAAIDERKIDIYFANGIDTSLEDARSNTRDVLEPAIQKEFYKDELGMKKYIGKVALSYNQTDGKAQDIWESIAQKLNFQELIDILFDTTHDSDLTEQVKKYRQSIIDGHRVLVVAHSQGNLFTGKAYNTLESWMQNYFFAVSVASPRLFKIKFNTPHIAFANDVVPYLGGVFIPINNPNEEAGSIESHAFSYYMGLPSEVTNVSTNVAKIKIMRAISDAYKILNIVGSQWKVKQTIGCGCDQKISLQHIEPAANLDHLMEGTKVLEFNLDGKLYQLPDETNTSMIWIKGSPTGVSIENVQKKLPNICYQLTGTDEIIEGSQNPNPHNGLLRVVLNWTNNAIDLNLNVVGPTPGTKEEHPDYACPRENWYIENESGLAEGHYIVSVTAPSNIDESLMPEQIRLDVKAEGKGEYIAFDINNTLMLNLGEVYDINITLKDNGGAAGDGSFSIDGHRTSSSGHSVTYHENDEGSIYTADIILLLKQLALGPIAGASLLLEKFNNGEWQELYTGVTTSGSSINSNGLIIFPSTLQTAVSVDDILLLTASGGQDVDADDDFNLDVTPTTVLGKLHAFMDSENVIGNRLKVNILTEIIYQAVYKRVKADTTKTELISMLDDITKMLIKNDINNDVVISYEDATSWLAGFNKKALHFDYDEKIEPIVQKIYSGDDIYLDVYKLLYAGKVNGINVDTNESVNDIYIDLNSYTDLVQLQKEDFVLKDSSDNVIDFTFSISNGSVVINPLNRLVEGQSYTLQFSLEIYDSQDNVYLDTHLHEFIVPDITPPVIPESVIHANENTTSVPVKAIDPSAPLKYTINGGVDKDKFEVKSRYYNYVYNDYIAFKEAPNYEQPLDSNADNIYELDISVTDSFSNTTTQNIQIIVDDVVEGPELADTYLSVDENMPTGTYVGDVSVVNEGDGNLTEFFIYRESEYFRIDNTGKIYTKAVFDHERKSNHLLRVRAKNSVNAYSSYQDTSIAINDISEPLPEVHAYTGSMDDNAPAGKVVGQLYVYPGLGSEVQVKLTGLGSDDFTINSSGLITVSDIADLNHTVQKEYNLKAVANNTYGESNEANVTIYINSWTRQYGTTTNDFVQTMSVDQNNNVYVAEKRSFIYNKSGSTYVNKFDSSGELLWEKEYSYSEKINIYSIVVDHNGIIYLAGSKGTGKTYTKYNRTYDKHAAWLSALSSDGDLLWTRSFDVNANGQDSFSKILLDSDGNLLAAGQTSGAFEGYINRGYRDIIITKLSPDSNLLFLHQMGSTNSDYIQNIKFNKNNRLYALTNHINASFMELDQTNGHVLSSKSFSSPSNHSYYSYEDFDFDDAGNIYVLIDNYIWSESTIDGVYTYEDDVNCVVLKLNPEMNEIWRRSYGSSKRDLPEKIAVNSNKNFIL